MTGKTQALDENAVRRAYARGARFYDAVVGPVTDVGRAAAVAAVNALARKHAGDAPMSVLEVGVGSGLSLPGYARTARITGIDLSSDMLALARRRVTEQALGHVAALEEMDAGALTFETGSFDCAVAMYVMSVAPNPEAVLDELARITRPGGEVVIVNHFAKADGWVLWFERKLERAAALIGWHPAFGRERMLNHPDLELVREQPLGLLGIFTLMRFRKRS
ncbi:MAG: class I SAM-dependent methyltransferase [Candidatus Phaeomarinobacter sp.]